MKIYIEEAEIGSTISYTEENGKKQNLYVHDKEGFVFKSLKEKLAEKNKEFAELKEKLIDATDFKDAYYHDLEELKKENQLLRKTLNNLKGDKASDTLVNAVNAYYEPLLQDRFDDIERLKKELTEKDKEIEEQKEVTIELVAKCKTLIDEKYDLEKLIMLRHEICEKIRNIASKYWTRLEDDNENLVDYYITPKELDDIIDEVEK